MSRNKQMWIDTHGMLAVSKKVNGRPILPTHVVIGQLVIGLIISQGAMVGPLLHLSHYRLKNVVVWFFCIVVSMRLVYPCIKLYSKGENEMFDYDDSELLDCDYMDLRDVAIEKATQALNGRTGEFKFGWFSPHVQYDEFDDCEWITEGGRIVAVTAVTNKISDAPTQKDLTFVGIVVECVKKTPDPLEDFDDLED